MWEDVEAIGASIVVMVTGLAIVTVSAIWSHWRGRPNFVMRLLDRLSKS